MSLATIAEKWEQAGLRRGKLDELLALGGFSEEVLWVNLLALACTALEDVCELRLAVLTVAHSVCVSVDSHYHRLCRRSAGL